MLACFHKDREKSSSANHTNKYFSFDWYK